MNEDFKKVIHNLKTDQFYAVSVLDYDTGRKLLPSKTGSDIIQIYGSIESFFESLFSKGVKEIKVVVYRKNGSTFKNMGKAYKFSFNEKPQSNPAPTQNYFNNNAPAMNQMGLGVPELAGFMADSRDKERLAAENEYLKAQNNQYAQTIYELKEEKLKREYDVTLEREKKESHNNMINTLVTTFGPALGGMLMKQNPAAGLAQPAQPIENYSELKKGVIDSIKHAQFPEEYAEVFYKLIGKLYADESYFETLKKLSNE